MQKKVNNVSVVIPAYNEEDNIETTLVNLNYKWIKEIIVINDGSVDSTLDKIQKHNVKIVNFQENKGKGKAVEAGLKIAQGEIIALIDADLGQSVREITKLLKPVIAEKIDITIAVIEIEGGGLGIVRWLAEKVILLFTGKIMCAPLSGQRVFHRKILNDILPLSGGFGLELGMDLDIIKKNIEYREISCNFKHRITGHNLQGYLHRFQQLLDILITLWNKRRYLWIK